MTVCAVCGLPVDPEVAHWPHDPGCPRVGDCDCPTLPVCPTCCHQCHPLIIDAYAGPRGWSEGLRTLGLADIGIENDPSACATAVAAGHRTIRADATTFPLDHLAGIWGLIMSPPCQAFSTAGNGEGRAVLDGLVAMVYAGYWDQQGWADERIRHVLQVGRWAETLHPTWIACEQVPPCLPIWEAYVARWRGFGWSAWAGILNAADYGVPQTRLRAFLLARTDGQPVHPPEPTHCAGGALTMFGELEPWVTMADALGWSDSHELHHLRWAGMAIRHGDRPGREATAPAIAITGKARSMYVLDRRNQSDGVPVRLVDCATEPAPTLTGIAGAKGQWVVRTGANSMVTGRNGSRAGDGDVQPSQSDNAIRLTVRDALILQGFRPDYPVQGTRTKQFEQIGNAVCPPLAVAVIAAVAHLREPAA